MNNKEEKKVLKCTNNNFMPNLTLGKPYEVADHAEDDNKFVVIDDSGRQNTYYMSRFENDNS